MHSAPLRTEHAFFSSVHGLTLSEILSTSVIHSFLPRHTTNSFWRHRRGCVLQVPHYTHSCTSRNVIGCRPPTSSSLSYLVTSHAGGIPHSALLEVTVQGPFWKGTNLIGSFVTSTQIWAVIYHIWCALFVHCSLLMSNKYNISLLSLLEIWCPTYQDPPSGKSEQDNKSDPKRPILLLYFFCIFLHLMMKTRPCTVHVSIEYNNNYFTIYTHWNIIMLKTQTAPHPCLNCFQMTHQNKTLKSSFTIGHVRHENKKQKTGKKTAKPPFYMLCKCCSISLQ